MARPRTFDEGHALEGAVQLFWEKGYEAATTQELCTATGLGRSSIYNTFASKHALFLRALARYLDTMAERQEATLAEAEHPPADRLRALFAGIVETEEARRRAGRGIGCLGVNTSAELAGRDPEVTALLERDMERRLRTLREVIRAGQLAGELSRKRTPQAYALLVNATIAGMRISAQNGADRAALESIAEAALDSMVEE